VADVQTSCYGTPLSRWGARNEAAARAATQDHSFSCPPGVPAMTWAYFFRREVSSKGPGHINSSVDMVAKALRCCSHGHLGNDARPVGLARFLHLFRAQGCLAGNGMDQADLHVERDALLFQDEQLWK
jgi:hypothetical protein